jgi:Ca2+-binding EF-hand superfamily protein
MVLALGVRIVIRSKSMALYDNNKLMSDSQIKKTTDYQFKQHDKDGSGYLDAKELGQVINNIFHTQGSKRHVTDQ